MNKKFFLFLCLILFLPFFSFASVYSNDSIVSYYAEDFHGKKTSCGEIYNMYDMTCASKELPFDTKLKVTNLANGKSVTVRVNDRGPFVPDRELDLSKAAATKLDMIKSGTAHVKIEIIELGPNTKASQQTADKAKKIMQQRFPGWKPHGNGGGKVADSAAGKAQASNKTSSSSSKKIKIDPSKVYDIQLGAFSTRENANTLAQQLLREGFKDVVFQKGNGIYRVVIRQVRGCDVEEIIKKLNKNGHNEYTVRERKN